MSGLLILIAAIHFGAYVVAQSFGRVVGLRLRRRESHQRAPKTAVVEGSLFGLLALLLAFTFDGAQDRLDARRRLIVDEVAAMGTAYARLDLLPAAAQPEARELFKQYADARIAFYRTVVADRRVAKVQHSRASELQGTLWQHATAALRQPGADPTWALLVLPALNTMFDVTVARDVAIRTHLPLPVMLLLEVLALTCAFFAGLDMGRKANLGWMHVVVFALMLAVTAYVIADLEFPRVGLAQVTGADAQLVRVREAM
jgi:hypothetical protein